MRIVVIVLALTLLGCGDDGPPLVPDPDAAAPPDAEIPDAEVPDAIPPCPECDTGYVFSSLEVPLDADHAEELGFDLDGDGTIDNQIGNVFGVLTQASGGAFDLQGSHTRAVGSGAILLLGSLQECLPGLCLFTFHGADPAPAPCLDPGNPSTCGQHLAGTGLFTAEPPLDRFVPGTQVGDVYTGGPGLMVLELSFGGPTAARFDLVAARASLTGVSPTGITGGRLGGAIPEASVETEILPVLHAQVVAQIAADCPGGGPPCGCEDGSTGETFLGIFDDNTDCAVPLEELLENPLITTLFRSDVDTDADDVPDSLSIGFGVTATGATFRN